MAAVKYLTFPGLTGVHRETEIIILQNIHIFMAQWGKIV